MAQISKIGLVLILLTVPALMITSSMQEAAIIDELAHIPAGYGYVKYFDYRLNPEHPPLVKALAAFPLLFLDLKFPTDSTAWTVDVNGQWATGAQFLYESGNDADRIIQWARLGPMLLTLLLIIFVYIWSKELLGATWALLPTVLLAFSPTVLAHGHYVTTDIGATLGILLSLYTFTKFLISPSRRNLILAGVAFGFAQLLKFSAVILMPTFGVILFLYYLLKIKQDLLAVGLSGKLKALFTRGSRYAFHLIVIFTIGFLVVYPFYLLTSWNYPIGKQVEDTKFLLSSFSGGPTPVGENCRGARCLAELNIWLSQNPLTRPYAEYLLGILMVGQRSTGGNALYFLGDLRNTGGPLYFPIVFLLKEPLPSLILIFLTLGFFLYKTMPPIWRRRRAIRDSLMTNFAEVSMGIFVLIYLSYSIYSPLNIGVRHLLPTMPFIYLLTTVALKSWLKNNNFFKAPIKIIFIGLLTMWYLVGVLLNHPHYISYFNDLVGTNNGWRLVADSNYDWGQDLKRLKKFVENPLYPEKIDKIAVDYFGGGNVKYYLGDKSEYWSSAKGNPLESNIKWLAISINTLQGAKGELKHNLPRTPEDEYRWLKDYEHPYARAGKSIFIYKLQ